MCSVEINKIGLFQGAKWCTSKDGQPHDMSKSDKKLLNNVTEEPNLQTKQSDIQVLDFCLNVWGRYSKEQTKICHDGNKSLSNRNRFTHSPKVLLNAICIAIVSLRISRIQHKTEQYSYHSVLNHKYATTVTLEYRRKKYNKNYGMDQSSVRVKMENQTSHRKVLL